MKELSIEEKAKRYDEAIKLAKDSFNYPSYPGFIRADVVFPELKKSEDERIRKAIKLMYSFLPNNPKYIGGVPIKEIFAWLEKQGKNNMGISEATKKKLEDNLNKALEKETPESWNKFLDEQGEQKSADKVEPKFRVGDTIHKIGENTKFPMVIEEIKNGEYVCNNNHVFINTKFQDEYELVEQKSTWNEEDSPYYDDICEILINLLHSETADVNKDVVQKDLDWLKYLKERYTWKPSEGHIKALADAIEKYSGKYSSTLCQLYNELKNLTE